MKIAIVNNQAPFVRGGAELLAEWLHDKLEEYGHQAEIVRIPFQWSPPERIVDHMLAARLVRVANVDRVVALKFPAYYVPHENKVLWLLHQFRQAYDLWGTPYQDIPNTPMGIRIREAVVEGDRRYLQEVRRIYTISKIVGNRLNLYSGLKSKALFPPLLDSEPYRCEEYGDYFFFPSRINAGKRQHLAVEAMAYVTSSARLVIAGQPETPTDLGRLMSVIREHGLESRVEVIPRWITEEEKLCLLAGARGVVYLPFDEDYGYVTLEAFHASKPVLTLTDAGGPLELIEHGRNGFICEGTEMLAKAIDELSEDRALTERLGQAALDTINERDISWDRVIRCLTQ
ncbi:MAG TPA: glycosyltransferase family 4 protein [Solirubrobacteraceae bacterium]|jgi:glycosyltransferase involved in cell wall biosynthesis|nr:glycosyltransferase family 4 protein [Solirubrobacteraceae bacterium]